MHFSPSSFTDWLFCPSQLSFHFDLLIAFFSAAIFRIYWDLKGWLSLSLPLSMSFLTVFSRATGVFLGGKEWEKRERRRRELSLSLSVPLSTLSSLSLRRRSNVFLFEEKRERKKERIKSEKETEKKLFFLSFFLSLIRVVRQYPVLCVSSISYLFPRFQFTAIIVAPFLRL